MEWLKKILETQGLNEEQSKAIVEGVENNYKGYVPPHRFEEINAAKKKAEDGIQERDKQLEELKKSAGDSVALQETISKLQDENKTAAEKYESDLKEYRTNAALKLSLKNDVHDTDLVVSLLDKKIIELDEAGNVKAGLNDQLKALRETKGFLFVEKQEETPKFKGAKPPEGGSGKGGYQQPNPWKKDTLNLTEQGRLLRENPDLAKQMQAAAK